MAKEEKKAPKLRFNGYTNDWERKKLGDIVEFYSGLTYKPENIAQSGTLVIRSSNIHNSKYVNADNVYVKNNIVNSEYVKKQDIVVVVRNGSRNLIGKHALLTSIPHNPSVIGAFMTGIRSSDNQFIETLLNTEQFKREINKNLGATINQITTSQFKKMRFHVSKQKENKQIGVLFTYLDNSINLHERKCEELTLIKKSLLQKLFPKEDKIKPEIRYKNFSDAWEQRKLGEVFDTVTDYVANGSFKSLRDNVKSYTKENYAYMIRLQDASNNWKGPWLYTDEAGYSFLTKSKLHPNDIIMSNVGSVGKFFLIPELDKPMTLAPNAVLIKSSKNNALFLYQMMISTPMQVAVGRKTTPGVQLKINKTDFKRIQTNLPSLNEQEKIGEFFKQLDSLIALHQRKLEKLKQLKKFLLQNMFI